MSDIVLSAATRNSLLAAQKTAELLDTTQGHLATGKKINSALDNPLNFFAAASLDGRASDLSALLDSISNGIQTIQAASKAISSIQKLVDSAKSTATQAVAATLSTAGTASTVFGSTVTTTTYKSSGTATGAYASPGSSTTVTFTYGGATKTATIATTDTLAQAVTKLNTAAGATIFSEDAGNAGHIKVDSTSTGGPFAFTAGAAALGFAGGDIGSTTSSATSRLLTSATAVTFKVNGTTVTGTIPANSSAADAVAYLNGLSGVPTGSFAVDPNGKIVVNSSANLIITDSTTKTALGLSGASGSQATELVISGAATRATLAQQYNDLLTQIDQLAGDASYNGVNLVNNANVANKLRVAFNERNTSAIDIQGQDARSSGLGLAAVDTTANGTGLFQSDTDIKATIDKLTAATASLRVYASNLGSSLTVVQNRQDFTKNLINTLQTGSAYLVNADLNEEAANSQALTTRQSLAVSSLSLANQAQQAVLKLLQ